MRDVFDHEAARGDVGAWMRKPHYEVTYKQRHRWVWELHITAFDGMLVYGKVEADGGVPYPILAIGSFSHAIDKADRILRRINAD